MKKVFCFAFVVLLIGGCATYEQTPIDPAEVQYQRVVETEKTKEEGYSTSLNWFADCNLPAFLTELKQT